MPLLSVLEACLSSLASFAEGTLVIGGDFNVTVDPHKDSSTGSYALSQRSRIPLKESFYLYQLADKWRIVCPQERDYTFFSSVHRSYSRIDLSLVSNAVIPMVSRAHIDHIALSDHAPISLKLALQHPTSRSYNWRINESLLQDPEVIADILQRMDSQVFPVEQIPNHI